MVFGNPQGERLQLNDVTFWSGGPQSDQNRPKAYKALPEIREALQKRAYAEATSLVAKNMTSTVPYEASYQTLGDLNIDYQLPEGKIIDYWRWLDIRHAVAAVEFKVGADTYERESFASHVDGVIVTHVQCSRPGRSVLP